MTRITIPGTTDGTIETTGSNGSWLISGGWSLMATDICVRASHPSKIAKGGAAIRRPVQALLAASHQLLVTSQRLPLNNESRDNRNFSRFPASASFNVEVRGRGRPRYVN